jgi:hypothetical protein
MRWAVTKSVSLTNAGMGHLLGDHPLVGRVPPQHFAPTRPTILSRDVVVGALPVPHLPTGVARIGEYRSDRSKRPPITSPMPVPTRIHDGRTRHTLVVERAGNGRDAVSGQPLAKDPSNRWGGGRIGFEPP